MELITLSDDFRSVDMVEGYSSLIWTERHREAGDFELKTSDILKTMQLMPRGSLVSLQESREMMIVETHSIEEDPDDGEDTLTVTGRSFEVFLEKRVARHRDSMPLHDSADKSIDWIPYPSGNSAGATAAAIIIHRALTNSSYGEKVPDLIVEQSLNSTTTGGKKSRKIAVKAGNIYERVLEILAMDDLGIRTMRPAPIDPGYGYIYIYAGTKKSNVVLSVSAGHFSKTKYLWSVKDYVNMVWAFSQYHWISLEGSAATGLDRRIGYLEATDIKSTNPTVKDPPLLEARAKAYLEDHKELFVFEGDISSEMPYKYDVDYYLGDRVIVQGNYGIKQEMIVTEYTRAEDKNGEKTFPTLVMPES